MHWNQSCSWLWFYVGKGYKLKSAREEKHRAVWAWSKHEASFVLRTHCTPGINAWQYTGSAVNHGSPPEFATEAVFTGLIGWLPMQLNSITQLTEIVGPKTPTLNKMVVFFWHGRPPVYDCQLWPVFTLNENTTRYDRGDLQKLWAEARHLFGQGTFSTTQFPFKIQWKYFQSQSSGRIASLWVIPLLYFLKHFVLHLKLVSKQSRI